MDEEKEEAEEEEKEEKEEEKKKEEEEEKKEDSKVSFFHITNTHTHVVMYAVAVHPHTSYVLCGYSRVG